MKLEDFIAKWNETHKRFEFSLIQAPLSTRPTSVEVRYPAAKYQKFYSTDKWNELRLMVDALSHGTMVATTNEELFEKGILELKIASQNHNYQDRLAIATLSWIGEELFTNR